MARRSTFSQHTVGWQHRRAVRKAKVQASGAAVPVQCHTDCHAAIRKRCGHPCSQGLCALSAAVLHRTVTIRCLDLRVAPTWTGGLFSDDGPAAYTWVVEQVLAGQLHNACRIGRSSPAFLVDVGWCPDMVLYLTSQDGPLMCASSKLKQVFLAFIGAQRGVSMLRVPHTVHCKQTDVLQWGAHTRSSCRGPYMKQTPAPAVRHRCHRCARRPPASARSLSLLPGVCAGRPVCSATVAMQSLKARWHERHGRHHTAWHGSEQHCPTPAGWVCGQHQGCQLGQQQGQGG